MPKTTPASILRIHISEGDKYAGRPLFEAMVAKCREMKIAGATVFRGLEGYGETAEIHRRHVAGGDQPVIVVVVDTAENISRIKPVLEEMIATGMIAVSMAEMIRVQKS
jgi:uncharacterized protein